MNVKHVKLRLTIGNAVKRDRGQSSAWLGYAQRAVCCCNTSRFISWLNVCESRTQSWRFNGTPYSYITRGPKAKAEGCHVSQKESLGHWTQLRSSDFLVCLSLRIAFDCFSETDCAHPALRALRKCGVFAAAKQNVPTCIPAFVISIE